MSALTISPEDEKRVKGMGFLNNRGTDLFSARVLTTNGKVTAAQHRCMADAAEKRISSLHCEQLPGRLYRGIFAEIRLCEVFRGYGMLRQ